ncbi:MAG: MBL fold metallo-hydrolase [Thermoplasmata archaeon M11B2D]|nr:MAG: MBL fold metallo-hydrolase [Thermoplasmata archaeon M11B2D]PNX52439.1 MAG: MBL fold metallo-hydrolase [Thermoplasmata archaeon M9B2D]
MVIFTFYGGVNEIGGNKILLEDQGTKVFLDFGMSFSRRGRYFEEFLNPRTANGIGDFLEMGLLPDIPGIYRTDLLTHLGRKPEEPVVSGVLLSHAHADHANYISFLHKDIPIYCGETCKRILDAVAEQSTRDLENEVVDFRLRPLRRSQYKIPPVIRKFHTFTTGKTVRIDSLEIQPLHVDHSVPGAYGFIIYTSEGAFVYTGDLRMHGLHADMTDDFVSAAIQSKPVAMITEGTRIDKKRTYESEQKIYQDSKQKIHRCKTLSLVDFNFKDVDRFTTFYTIAKNLGKTLVINFKHACFLEQYHKDKKLKVPPVTDPSIALLKPKRLTGTYQNEDYVDAYIKKRLGYKNILTAADITKNPLKYMVVLNFWYFSDLIDLKPKKGVYIHSLSEPFNEEMEISYERMRNWLTHFDIEFFQSHCSGHINGDDLKELITSIHPKTLYPIHTEHPELFKNLNSKITRVKEGKTYKL